MKWFNQDPPSAPHVSIAVACPQLNFLYLLAICTSRLVSRFAPVTKYSSGTRPICSSSHRRTQCTEAVFTSPRHIPGSGDNNPRRSVRGHRLQHSTHYCSRQNTLHCWTKHASLSERRLGLVQSLTPRVSREDRRSRNSSAGHS